MISQQVFRSAAVAIAAGALCLAPLTSAQDKPKDEAKKAAPVKAEKKAEKPKPPAFTDAAKAGPDFAYQGEYVSEVSKDGNTLKIGSQIIALGDGKFQAVGYIGGLPGDGWDKGERKTATGELKDGVLVIQREGARAEIKDGVIKLFDGDGNSLGEGKKVERVSPTMGAKPPQGAVVLFDGSSIDAFTNGALTEDKLLTPKGNIRSKEKFGDCSIHLEFRTPYMPTATGQQRGNSGCYIGDRYECQILDSFGLTGENNECGGFYQIRKPNENMCFPPLAWQTYDIDYTAAKYDDAGKKTASAVVTVRHNGVVIHENVELPKETPGSIKEGPEKGSLHLQDHGNPVTFRNIWVLPKS